MSLIRVSLAAAAAALVVALTAASVTAEDAPASGGDKTKFVGDEACKKCHFNQHKAWKKTTLAKAMDSLKPTEEANKALFDKKKAAGLDPAKDYTVDASCLPCHTTGYDMPGGYPKDPAANDDAKKLAAAMGKVGCESCHGPGEKYVAFKKAESEKNPEAKFTKEMLAPHGLVEPDAKTCAQCHNEKSPTKAEFKFDEEKGKTHPTKK